MNRSICNVLKLLNFHLSIHYVLDILTVKVKVGKTLSFSHRNFITFLAAKSSKHYKTYFLYNSKVSGPTEEKTTQVKTVVAV